MVIQPFKKRKRRRNPFKGKRADFISKSPLFYKVMKGDKSIIKIKKRKK